MALPPPSPKAHVPRDEVSNEVKMMLKLDDRVRWIAVVFEKNDGVQDLFTVTPWTSDPTAG
ncbi:MAG: hypothetical protein K2X67_08630 [Burkholderiales bacterium]|jgi:hypothetical protein|nr:hypothetical protein [Burkholderiales bacterium]